MRNETQQTNFFYLHQGLVPILGTAMYCTNASLLYYSSTRITTVAASTQKLSETFRRLRSEWTCASGNWER